MTKYIVYNNAGFCKPICICDTETDAEEMCLELAWDQYQYHCYIADAYLSVRSRRYNPTLINSSDYRYMEAPYV